MAASGSTNPFSPEETRRILHHLRRPAVFRNMTSDWPVLRWTAERLSDCLGDKPVRFRLGRRDETNTPLFETQCSYVEATLDQFLNWSRDQTGTAVGSFCGFPRSEFWAYADYKYIAVLFQDQPSMFQDVRWSQFGFEGRDGRESTLWVGGEGANTPCHLDAYGCNLVLQVQGRKRWFLFPPEDTAHLYPTRIPYEESSVFSQVDVLRPDLSRFPAFHRARAHVVTLQPGQVLFVPRLWWHYVESLDRLTVSVNSWIEMDEDDVSRVGEAVTRTVVSALKRDDDPDGWLNPTEDGVASHEDNLLSVTLALRACALKPSRRTQEDQRGVPRPVKRDSRGHIREDSVPFRVPYGPHLSPVEEETSTDLEVRAERDALTGFRSRDSSEEPQLPVTITTNELLDCLVHPDVIARVTQLLLERHAGSHRNNAAAMTTPS